MIDIRTIGAGGGSIAWIDKGGMLRVGPQSAGAAPGPACYGQGGTEATVTDANLVLGRLNPDYFLGGRMTLDADAAHARGRGRRRAARPRPCPRRRSPSSASPTTTWWVRLRSVLIERGLDPRDFTLCAFGGAGPLHAAALMREMGLAGAIVPNHPGQFSALRLHPHRRPRRPAAHDPAHLQPLRPGPGARDHGDPGRRRPRPSSPSRATRSGIEVQRGLEMRYLGQNYELELPVGDDALDDGADDRLWQSFHAAHEARFGFAIPGDIIEIVTYTVTAISRTAKPDLPRLPPAEGPPVPVGERRVLLRRRRGRDPDLPPRRPARRPCAGRPRPGRGGGLGHRGRARPAPDRRRLGATFMIAGA